jgi:hypothetical protein
VVGVEKHQVESVWDGGRANASNSR